MRVIHLAADLGKLDVLRVLLQAGANPNSVDDGGRTPLMMACLHWDPVQALLVARELLMRGADPVMLDKRGFPALHYAGSQGDTALIDMLLTNAPTTLNHVGADGMTLLGVASFHGNEGAVSHVLSAGANNTAVVDMWRKTGRAGFSCPLRDAVKEGHEGVVRVLLNEGLEAVGGLSVIPSALFFAVTCRRARILDRLISVEGKKRRRYWANFHLDKNMPILNLAAGQANPAVVGVLLAAGADEMTTHPAINLARNFVDAREPVDEGDAENKAAIHRTLERGPAFRARSWTWPSRRNASADADAAADAGAAGAGAAAAAAADAAPLCGGVPRIPLGVRVFRARSETQRFANLVCRYAQKM